MPNVDAAFAKKLTALLDDVEMLQPGQHVAALCLVAFELDAQTQVVDAVAGVVDFVRVVGGNGRFKDLIGGYAILWVRIFMIPSEQIGIILILILPISMIIVL